MADALNLYQKLLKITEEIGKIEKTGRNAQQDYAFIEQAKVVAELRPQLAKHGVVIMPETVGRRIDHFTNSKGTNFIHVNVVSRYTLINADNPEDRFVCEWDAGEALDTGDKATNKATTASNKYFLMKLFNISDQEDPDAESPRAPEPPKHPPRPARPAQADETAGEATPTQKARITALLRGRGVQNEDMKGVLASDYGVDTDTLTKEDADRVIEELQ